MEPLIANIKKWIEGKSKKQKFFISLITFSVLATGALFSMGTTSSVANDPLNATPFYYLGAFIKLIAVLLLIVACSIVFRRWFQGGPNSRSIRQMQLMETIRLSPKQALHLVSINGQKLMIGATDQNISLLASLEAEAAPVTDEESKPQPSLDFGSIIRSINFDYNPDGSREKA